MVDIALLHHQDKVGIGLVAVAGKAHSNAAVLQKTRNIENESKDEKHRK